MRLLILGGGVFLGAAVLDAARERGHSVTLFNRGRTRSAWPEGVQVCIGERRRDLHRLEPGRWDAVIDTCGYVPADLQASVAALRTAGRYLFVSSVSACASFAHAPVQEDDALAAWQGIAPDDRSPEHYGAQKAACEAVLRDAFGARATIVRPGLIVGPGDPTGRFSYWPWRVAAGGPMLVPAAGARPGLQCIDVRDLGAWMVDLVEHDQAGVFNATGPVGGAALDWPGLVDACVAAVAARGGAPARPVEVGETFLATEGVAPWSELPLWLPSTDAGHAGFMQIDTSRAQAAGLRTRPLADTVGAVLDEAPPAPDDPRRSGKLTREREAGLLARWPETAAA